MERVIQAFERHLQEYIDASVERIARSLTSYAAGPEARLREGVTRFFLVLREDIVRGTASVYPEHVAALGALRAREGIAINELMEAIVAQQDEILRLSAPVLPLHDGILDAGVVGHLVQAAQAAKLLGTKVVLAGMHPRMAQEVVGLGLELRGILVVSTLASAMKHALRLQGKAILALSS